MGVKNPLNLHYKVSLPAAEGIFHVRIYTIHNMHDHNAGLDPKWGGRAGSLNLHAKLLFSQIYEYPVIELDPFDVESIGGVHVSAEGELLQGIPRVDQMPIEFKSRRLFMPLIQAIRSLDWQVWLEITLEQKVTDLPANNRSFIYPKKTISWYWGRLDRHEARETVKYQSLTKGFVKRLTRTPIEYDGQLRLSFMNWIKSRGSNSAKEFLDAFKETRPVSTVVDQYENLEAILKGLMAYISPTELNFATDHRLKVPHDSKTDSYFVDIELPFFFGTDAFMSNHIRDWQIRYSIFGAAGMSKHSAFFFNDPSGGNSQSFYRWKDSAQGLFELCRDMLLFPQWEIPTLEDVRGVPTGLTNKSYEQAAYWQACTRFLFLSYDNPPLKLYVDVDDDSIDLSFAATWAKSYKVELPSVDKLLPAPAYSIVTNESEGGSEQSYKTLFRLVGQEYVNNVLSDSPRGWEIYVFEGATIKAAKKIRYGDQEFTNWATFHASYKMNLWGSVRSMLELEVKGVAIEPYGDSVTGSFNDPRNTFSIDDFGEFPLVRVLEFRGGLIVNNETDVIQYLLIDIDRTPNGGSKLKLLELKQYTPPPDGAIEEGPGPVAPPPRDEDPPTVTIGFPTGPVPPVTGTVTVNITAADPSGISNVKFYVNGIFQDVLMHPTTGDEFHFAWNTTALADGTYTLKATAFDNAGNSASATVTAHVDNIPGGP